MSFRNNTNMAGGFLSLVLVVLSVGCSSSTSGNKIERDRLADIRKGVTTRKEVEAMFGPPASLSIAGDGKRMAFWQYTEAEGHANAVSYIPLVGTMFGGTSAKARSQHLQVVYNKQDVVEDFVFSGNAIQTDDRMAPWGNRTNTQTTAEEPAAAH